MVEQKHSVFNSTHIIHHETATTPSKGVSEFQISHRFIPPVSEGHKNFYGLDGPVNMRLGYGYALLDGLFITLARSNVRDNSELQVKYRFLNLSQKSILLAAAIQGGLAWNTNIFGRSDTDSRNFQYYGQLIINAKLGGTLALGLVPSYLYNSDIFSDDYKENFGLGLYSVYYATGRLGMMFEYHTILSGYRLPYDLYSTGVELQTAGHFFKLFISNSVTLNPSQYLSGTNFEFKPREWRLGFMITRLLYF
jgi:hypothetical protein